MPETRSALLDGLADKGFSREALDEMQHIIEAQDSDLFDVLAYVAFASPAIAHYVKEGVDELATEKLSALLRLMYHNALADAVTALGDPGEIRDIFSGFQRYLYQDTE